MLSSYRVLDLSDERGLLCGQILADLGADVLQVEPPEGSPARRLGPFYADEPNAEHSLYWWAFARNKRGVTADLETEDGREFVRKLVPTAHFLIESDSPGAMARRGLGYEDLAELNPGLVYASITPFGQTGPKAQHRATDLTVLAAGGPLVLSGDDDRPPVRLSVPQAFLHASAEAAVGALVAHHERVRSGRGQHVDVSAQQAVAAATQADILSAAVGDEPLTRIAGGIRAGPLTIRLTFPAKDGHVSITHVFGSALGPAVRRLMEYVYDQGFCDEATRDKDWEAYTELLMSGAEPLEEFERVKRVIAECTASKTKAELLQAALERRLLMAPITTIADVVESEQLASRRYFRPLEHEPAGMRVRYPGPFARFGESPIRYERRAPRVGEHDEEIRAEGLATRAAPCASEPASAGGASNAPPLAGVKVLDFMWALAGPGATRTLADCGATVVRLESTTRLDVCRTLRPYQGGEAGLENSALFHNTNAGKRMITLDPRTPAGREVVLDLARWADVVTESFSPKGMRGLGLDYGSLRAVKPDIIMLSTCLMGQTGPLSHFAGYGNLAAAISGFYELAGWPDRGPAGPFGAYTDYIAPRYNAIAVLAALEYRRRTGRGQHIDLSQVEASLHFLAPAILEYGVNGRIASRAGNRDLEMAPHGVYPTRGEDRWIAIAVADDEGWKTLCAVLERPELASDVRFASAEARLERADELDRIVALATARHDMLELEARLQAAGVAAAAVQNSPELVGDPQLAHRGHFVELPHPENDPTVVEGPRFALSRTPPTVERSAPTMGCDNQYVLETILGYDDERIAELAIAGALD